MADEIVQKIKIETEGADQAVKQYESIGNAATEAGKSIEKAGETANTANQKAVESTAKAATGFQKFAENTNTVGDKLKNIGGIFAQASEKVASLGEGAAGVSDAITKVGTTFTQAGETVNQFSSTLTTAQASFKDLVSSSQNVITAIKSIKLGMSEIDAQNVTKTIGTAFDTAGKAVSTFGTGVIELSKKFEAVGGQGNVVSEALKKVGEAAQTAGGQISGWGKTIADAAITVGQLAVAAQMAAPILLALRTAVLGFLVALGPIGWLLIAINVALLAYIELAPLVAQNWDTIKSTVVNAVDTAKKKIDEWIATPVANAWQWITDNFQAAVDGIAQKIEAAKQLFADWITTPVANAWQWLVDTLASVWEQVTQLAQQGWDGIVQFVTSAPGNAWQWIVDTAQTAWDTLKQRAQEAKDAIVEFVTTAPEAAWQWIVDTFSQAIDKIFELVNRAKRAIQELIGLGGGSGGGGATPAPQAQGFARGGLIGGRGGGMSDSNLAWVSRGEHIMPARVVRQPGVLAFLEALRRSGGIPGYAEGGVVGSVSYAILEPVFNRTIDLLQEAGKLTVDAFLKHRDTMVDISDSIENAVKDLDKNLAGVVDKIFGAAAVLQELNPGNHARGGLLGGRGSGTSDSNLAWVSRGEYITPARAVRQPGVLAFLEALRRSGGDLRRVLDGLGHFALGGLVAPLPAFASGGIAGMSNVTIQFPGLQPISGLRAPSDVVEELRKAAAMAQVRSGGRKPSRYS